MFGSLNALKLREQILWGYSIPILLSIGATSTVYLNVKTVEKQSELLEESLNVYNQASNKFKQYEAALNLKTLV